MKLLTKESDYAIRALLRLAAWESTFISTGTLSKEESIPYAFLRRILSRLTAAGYIEAREGVAGGVRLVREPEKIKVTDVMELFQGKLELTECMFRKQVCSNRATCVLRKTIKGIEEKILIEFKGVTIGSLSEQIK